MLEILARQIVTVLRYVHQEGLHHFKRRKFTSGCSVWCVMKKNPTPKGLWRTGTAFMFPDCMFSVCMYGILHHEVSSTCFPGRRNRCNCWLLWLSRAVVIMWIYLIIRVYSSVLPAILLVTVCVHTCTSVSAIICIVCMRRFPSDSPSWRYLKSLDQFVLGAPGALPREGKKKPTKDKMEDLARYLILLKKTTNEKY